MTPREIEIFARLAGRAENNDSPFVLESQPEAEAARLIAPINNEQRERPTIENLDNRVDTLEKLQDRSAMKVNQLESQLGAVTNANDSPVAVLAVSLAQTRADVNEIKSLKDAMRLTPADVLSGVIKPTRLGSLTALVHGNFQIAGTSGSKINGTTMASDRTGSVKVRVFKDLETRPKNIKNLDGFGAAGSVLTKITGMPSAINGYVNIASNSGIEEIEFPNKDFNNSADILKLNFQPQSIDTIYDVPAANTISTFESESQIKGSRSISISSLFYNGVYATSTSIPTSGSAGYAFVTDSNTGRYYLWYHSAVGASYSAVNSSTQFTNTALTMDQSVDVLFGGSSGVNGLLVGLKFTTTAVGGSKYYWNAPTQFDPSLGAIHLVEDLATPVGTNNVRDMYIVRPSNKVGSTYNSQQIVTIIKPSSNEYYRFSGTEKYCKCSASSGLINLDIATTASTNTYFIDNNQIYVQAETFDSSRVKLGIHEWLFNTSNRKFITNISGSAQGFVPAGYYNFDDKLIRMNGLGDVIYDRTRGEVILYKFKNQNYKLTVPNITSISTMAQILNPTFDLVTQVSEELFIGADFKLKSQNNAVITDRVGLRYVHGDAAFARANKLYNIDAQGNCVPYSGLAYLEIEEDATTFAIRVWYTSTAGVITQLNAGEYLNDISNRVFKVGTTAPIGSYSTGNIADIAATGSLPAIQKTRNALLAKSTQIPVESLVRFFGDKLANIVKYQTLGLISGGTKTMADIVLLGGVEVITGISALYNGKFLRVMSGNDYEIVHIVANNNSAIANKSNSLINGTKLVQISGLLYSVDTDNNHKLIKVTSGYVFNDDADEKDIKAVKSDGSLDSALTATSDCLHFAYIDSLDGKKKIYWVDTVNSNQLSPVAMNTSYFHGTKASGVHINIVFLVKKPLSSFVDSDEEAPSENGSAYTMHLLDLETGTIKDLPIPGTDNNDSKNWIFRGDQFNSSEFKNLTSSTQSVYWHRDAGNNKPYINRIISDGNDFNTDGFGLRSSTPMVINDKYFIGSDNALLYGVGGTRISTNAASMNKYYIDYDNNLAKSTIGSGSRAAIVSGNYFVVFADNDNRARYYNYGRMVEVVAGTLIAVSSSAPAQSADHTHNGLKMWGKDTTGMFNRWLDFQADVARQSNDAPVSDVVNIYDVCELDTTASLTTGGGSFHSADFELDQVHNLGVLAVVLSYDAVTGSLPTADADNNGELAYDQTNKKITRSNGTLWSSTSATTPNTVYIRLDGTAIKATDANGTVTGVYGAVNDFVLVGTTVKKISVVGSGTSASTPIGSTLIDYEMTLSEIIRFDTNVYVAGKLLVPNKVSVGELVAANETTTAPNAAAADEYWLNTTVGSGIIKKSTAAGTSSWTAYPSNNQYFLRADGKLYKTNTGTGGIQAATDAVGTIVRLSNGTHKKISVVGSGTGLSSVGATLINMDSNEIFFDVSSAKSYKGDKLIRTNPESMIRFIGIVTGNTYSLYDIDDSGASSIHAPTSGDAIQRSGDFEKISKIGGVSSNTFSLTLLDSGIVTRPNSPFAAGGTLVNNKSAFVFIHKNMKYIRSKDESIYEVQFNGGDTEHSILVIDGIVQNERAPRGTKIYSSSGIKIRTGYSTAQANLDTSKTAKDLWV